MLQAQTRSLLSVANTLTGTSSCSSWRLLGPPPPLGRNRRRFCDKKPTHYQQPSTIVLASCCALLLPTLESHLLLTLAFARLVDLHSRPGGPSLFLALWPLERTQCATKVQSLSQSVSQPVTKQSATEIDRHTRHRFRLLDSGFGFCVCRADRSKSLRVK